MNTTWKIDPTHSEIEFKVKHLMISTVTGKFNTFDAEMVSADEDFSGAKVNFTADIASITTGNDMRDGHLKSDDFFGAENFPQLKFEGGSLEKKSDSDYVLKGNLTIRNITKAIELKVEFNGLMTDFYGNRKAGFEISGVINRKDFELKWTATTEAGGIVVSDDVKLICNVQMAKVA